MNDIPIDIEFTILLNLELNDLRNVCLRDRRMNQICSSNTF